MMCLLFHGNASGARTKPHRMGVAIWPSAGKLARGSAEESSGVERRAELLDEEQDVSARRV